MVLGFRMPQPIASRINNDGRGESVAYLRQLGALDESDPEAEGMPQVMATFNGTNIIKKAETKNTIYIYILKSIKFGRTLFSERPDCKFASA